ncbi:hypothetical protein Golomagni_04728, partial [Golovinomyces magnicellulatus]
MRYKQILVPIISLIMALVALILSVIAVVGNGKDESLQKFTTFSVNTSTFLQDAIEIEDSSKNGPDRNEKRNTVEDLVKGLPSLLSPALNLKSDSFGLGSQPKPTDKISEAGDDFFGQIIDPAVGLFENTLNGALNSLTSELIKSLGIRQWYGLYMGTFCSADYSPNFKDPDATLSRLKCKPLGGTSKSPQIQDKLQVGSKTIDVSVLDFANKLTDLVGQLTTIFRIAFIIQILAIVTTSIFIVIIPLLLLQKFHVKIVYLAIGSTAALAASLLLFTAIFQTLLATLISGIINQLGEGLKLYAEKGASQLAI